MKKPNRQMMLDRIHGQCLEWKSSVLFMEEEIIFFEHLLHSYLFEPDTAELYECFQNCIEQLDKIKMVKNNLKVQIDGHEATIGGIMESIDHSGDPSFYIEHDNLKLSVQKTSEDYRKLKSEILYYAITVMRKHKKPDEI
ncbi:hypothetical protein [uncultured Maribacter sp.]|uniref:hypothetical protein n=1 Tax=uncultured Maribacter sp. TaxID=431308 RepID=UPI0030D72748|tara:strand:+ start:508 stop:927 length:420 start_codon:yes stop_codon:yes gene_type:complete